MPLYFQTPICPLPWTSYTVTLPDALTNVAPTDQPYNNTKEIIFYNLSQTDSVYVQAADLMSAPAEGEVRMGTSGGFNAAGPPVVGDTLTIGIAPPTSVTPLTAVAGNQTSGANDFSAPTPATLTITVNAYPLPPNITITSTSPSGIVLTLTGVPGGGGAGTQTFDSTAGSPAAVASSIVTALNNATNYGRAWGVAAIFPAANVVSVFGYKNSGVNRYPSINNLNIEPWNSLVIVSSSPGNISTTASYTAAGVAQVQADSPIRKTDGTIDPDTENTVTNIAWNMITALRDTANVWADPLTPAAQKLKVRLPDTAGITAPLTRFWLQAEQWGAAGNLITYSASTPFPPPPAVPVRIGTLAGVFSGGLDSDVATATVNSTNSLVLPPLSAVTLSIGSEGNRQPFKPYNTILTPGGITLILRAASGTDVEVNVTYVQNRGYPDGV